MIDHKYGIQINIKYTPGLKWNWSIITYPNDGWSSGGYETAELAWGKAKEKAKELGFHSELGYEE